MKRKELRKVLTHLLKLNYTMTGSSHKCLTALQSKLYYLTIISQLPSYGAKCFPTNSVVSSNFNVDVLSVIGQIIGIFLGPQVEGEGKGFIILKSVRWASN